MVTQASVHVRQTEPGETSVPADTWQGKTIPGFLLPIQSGEEREEITPAIQPTTKQVQATPRLLHIGTLLDDRLRLKMPIEVEIEQEGTSYIAKCPYVEEFGYGESPATAIDDLQVTLAELYWTLKESEKGLGRNLVEMWERLREAVEER